MYRKTRDRIPGLDYISSDEDLYEPGNRIPGEELFYSDEPDITIPGLNLANPEEEREIRLPGMEFLALAEEPKESHDIIPGLTLVNKDPDFSKWELETPISGPRVNDFYRKDIRRLKAPITICKGVHLRKDYKATIVTHDPVEDPFDDIKEFVHELELIKTVNHENVLKFCEVVTGATESDVSLVLEPHGCLMSTIIKQNIMELYQPIIIQTIMRDLFVALNYLHSNHIIHGDIQPENIAFSSTGVLKVWNFRSARRVGQKPKKLNSLEFRYQAVEVIFETGDYDQSIDIWSANCIFAELWLKKSIFPEHGREKVLEGIFNLLGFPTIKIWSEFFSFRKVERVLCAQEIFKSNCIDEYFKKFCVGKVPENAMELIHRCFRYNPRHRPFSYQVLEHKYFTKKPEEERRREGHSTGDTLEERRKKISEIVKLTS